MKKGATDTERESMCKTKRMRSRNGGMERKRERKRERCNGKAVSLSALGPGHVSLISLSST